MAVGDGYVAYDLHDAGHVRIWTFVDKAHVTLPRIAHTLRPPSVDLDLASQQTLPEGR
jgi:hypothetical protein